MVVVRVEATFLQEALLGDEVRVVTWVGERGGASVTLRQRAFRGDSDVQLAEGSAVSVWLGPNRKPLRVPREVREALGIDGPH